ncbi:Uncharacterised protein [Starkeya nomas]|uniref:Uncharacterized protein n=1 Tax=Starkeya nomas TaxID=2666134 RepID=A0A5S9R4K7_9HYPH|nr:Uncharacterised protein [Starkeya nomas]
MKELTEAVARLVPMGLKVSQREMRQRIGVSEPEEDDDLLTPPSSSAPVPEGDLPADKTPPAAGKRAPAAELGAHHGGCGCASCRSGLPAMFAADPADIDVEAELDDFIAEAMADWQEDADPLLAPLREALAGASSFAELEAMLPEIAEAVDGKRLAMKLAIAMAKARGLGDVHD